MEHQSSTVAFKEYKTMLKLLQCRSNFVLANVKGAKEPWAVITDEEPTLQTLWQYALRFRIEELFLDSFIRSFSIGRI